MSIDKALAEQRLQELQAEIAKGQQQLNALEERRMEIQGTLLRLSGAVQVVTELLATAEPQEPAADAPKVVAAG